MKATELRIGNLIYDELLKFNSEVDITILGRILNTKQSFHRYEPIPLTEEWLLKFGFVRENEWVGYISDKYRIGIRFHDGNSAECDIIQDGKFISFGCGHIKYVHQLQNLFYSLTGTELYLAKNKTETNNSIEAES